MSSLQIQYPHVGEFWLRNQHNNFRSQSCSFSLEREAQQERRGEVLSAPNSPLSQYFPEVILDEKPYMSTRVQRPEANSCKALAKPPLGCRLRVPPASLYHRARSFAYSCDPPGLFTIINGFPLHHNSRKCNATTPAPSVAPPPIRSARRVRGLTRISTSVVGFPR
jgi:hypothetical protein